MSLTELCTHMYYVHGFTHVSIDTVTDIQEAILGVDSKPRCLTAFRLVDDEYGCKIPDPCLGIHDIITFIKPDLAHIVNQDHPDVQDAYCGYVIYHGQKVHMFDWPRIAETVAGIHVDKPDGIFDRWGPSTLMIWDNRCVIKMWTLKHVS